MHIPKEDLRIDTYRAKGKGGQNVNKVESAVRITHLPTGIVVTCQDERDQLQNRQRAMASLEAKLLQMKADKKKFILDTIRTEQMNSGRVRTYDFSSNMVTDHRRGTKTTRIKEVFDGNLALLEVA